MLFWSGVAGVIPALSAGPPFTMLSTMTPLKFLANPFASDKSGSMLLPDMPRYGWEYVPFLIRTGTILLIAFDGIANPTPAKSPVLVLIAVFIPMTLPSKSNNGPPEFPGLIAASTCIISGIENPAEFSFGSNLPIWLIIPVVMVSLSPNGLD